MTTQVLGWVSASLLTVTIFSQLHRQWAAKSSEGVSPLLYLGQLLASSGLAGYSWLRGDLVFVVLNIVISSFAVIGLFLWYRYADPERRRRLWRLGHPKGAMGRGRPTRGAEARSDPDQP